MSKINIFLLSFILVACASAAPKRNFTVNLWETDAKCIKRIDDDDNVIIICDNEADYPKDLAGITLDDYNKERDFQALLIKSCRRWKK